MQRSWAIAEEAPLHLERGFLRPGADGAWELALAHPLGLTEVAQGVLDGRSVPWSRIFTLSRKWSCTI
jgi:hypothetical protein